MLRFPIALAILLTACTPTHHAWHALTAPHPYYVVKPYTACMWQNEAPNAKVFNETCEDK